MWICFENNIKLKTTSLLSLAHKNLYTMLNISANSIGHLKVIHPLRCIIKFKQIREILLTEKIKYI